VFTPTRLKMLTERHYTVLVDFTAPWCLICKSNEAVALNRTATKDLVTSQDVVTLVANVDEPDSRDFLKQLTSSGQGVPYYAISPAGRAASPIVWGGQMFNEEPVLTALREAGPSRPSAEGTAVTAPAPSTERISDRRLP